jgi:hypothetical protein
MHYLAADAQNIAVDHLIKNNYEWLLLWEDDVIPPINVFQIFNTYMRNAKVPIVSGVYFTKGAFSEPIMYRGQGVSCHTNWKPGDKVWCSGVPTGMLLVHCSILKLMHEEAEYYTTLGNKKIKRVFETPTKIGYDPEVCIPTPIRATSDLNWCNKIVEQKVLKRAGWADIGRRKYPFLVDTRIMCYSKLCCVSIR